MKRFYAPILIGFLVLGCGGSSEKREAPVYGGTHSDTPSASKQPEYAPLKLENSKPELTKAELVMEGDTLKIVAEAVDKDGDKVQLKYAWTINDKLLSETPTFSNFKKGDRVVATVTPFDGKEEGAPRSWVQELANAPPQITPAQPVFDDPRWTYQVKATDPDGDELQYTLKNAPSGMTIDPKTGFIMWNTSGAPGGKHTATIQVSDGKGGTSEQTIEVSLSEEETQ